MNRKYSPELRGRALRMLAEAMPEHPTLVSAARHVAGMLGMSPETLRVWQRQAEVDGRKRSGVTSDATRTGIVSGSSSSVGSCARQSRGS
jgi:transposase